MHQTHTHADTSGGKNTNRAPAEGRVVQASKQPVISSVDHVRRGHMGLAMGRPLARGVANAGRVLQLVASEAPPAHPLR